jgi:hypothetical protein
MQEFTAHWPCYVLRFMVLQSAYLTGLGSMQEFTADRVAFGFLVLRTSFERCEVSAKFMVDRL